MTFFAGIAPDIGPFRGFGTQIVIRQPAPEIGLNAGANHGPARHSELRHLTGVAIKVHRKVSPFYINGVVCLVQRQGLVLIYCGLLISRSFRQVELVPGILKAGANKGFFIRST